MKKVFMVSTYGDFFLSFEKENIKLLQKLGYRVVLVANFEEEKYNQKKSEINSLNVEIINILFKRSPLSFKTLINYKRLKKYIKKEKPVMIDCHLAVVGVLARISCWNDKSIKVIYSPHGFFFYKGCPIVNSIIYKIVETVMALKTDALVTINSEDYRNAKKMPLRGKAYCVPGVGVDVVSIMNKKGNSINLRNLICANPKDFILVSVGELSKNKNHIAVIEAMRILKDKGINNIQYVICGRDDIERSIIENKVLQYKLEKNFHYLGYRTDIVEINKESDCFILPSFKEGLSVSIIEAMACGKPVIASKIRGNVDLIDEGKGGYLFEVSDYNELANCIFKLIKNKSYIEFGKYNREKCIKYSIENVQSKMLKIYKGVLNYE